MAASSTVTTGDIATAANYNNLRADVLSNSASHTHTGASDNGVKINSNDLQGTTLASTVVASSLTSVGTLTTLTVDNIIINGTNIGHTSDTDAIAIASDGVVTMNQIPVFSAGINVSGGTIAGTLSTAAQANITSVGTLTALTVDNISINGTTIGHTSDTDLLTFASGNVTVAGQVLITSASSPAIQYTGDQSAALHRLTDGTNKALLGLRSDLGSRFYYYSYNTTPFEFRNTDVYFANNSIYDVGHADNQWTNAGIVAVAAGHPFMGRTSTRWGGINLTDNAGSPNNMFQVYPDDADLGGTIMVLSDAGTAKIALDTDGNSYLNGGKVGIGTTSPSSYHANADDLVIYSTGQTGITLATNDQSTGRGSIYFSDGTSSDAEKHAGYIIYNHADNKMHFGTNGNGTSALVIDSSQNFDFVNNNLYDVGNAVNEWTGSGLKMIGSLWVTDAGTETLTMYHNGTVGAIETSYFTGSYTPITFRTSATERVRIDTDGDTIFYGASYNLRWDASDNALEFADGAVVKFGTGVDMTIGHSSNTNTITLSNALTVTGSDTGFGGAPASGTGKGRVHIDGNGDNALLLGSGTLEGTARNESLTFLEANNGSGGSAVRWLDGSGTWRGVIYGSVSGDNPFHIYANGGLVLAPNAGSGVGVGTTAPYTLTNYEFITINHPTNGGGIIMQDGSGRRGALYNGDSSVFLDAVGAFYLRTGSTPPAGTSRLIVSSGGYTNFGTASPVDYYKVWMGGAWTSGGSDSVAATVSIGSQLTTHVGDTSWAAHLVAGNSVGASIACTATVSTVATAYFSEFQLASGNYNYSSTVYIQGAATEGIQADYALWVDDGTVRIDGPEYHYNSLQLGYNATGAGETFLVYGDVANSWLWYDPVASILKIKNATSGTAVEQIIFYDTDSSYSGSITVNSTANTTAYNTSSDYRLKENEAPISNSLEKINKLNPYTFKWKKSESVMDGFFAHEVQEVVPIAVTGEKDGEDMQQMDYSKLVPLLTAAVQELSRELEELKK